VCIHNYCVILGNTESPSPTLNYVNVSIPEENGPAIMTRTLSGLAIRQLSKSMKQRCERSWFVRVRLRRSALFFSYLGSIYDFTYFAVTQKLIILDDFRLKKAKGALIDLESYFDYTIYPIKSHAFLSNPQGRLATWIFTLLAAILISYMRRVQNRVKGGLGVKDF
jgi:hypothetical protein